MSGFARGLKSGADVGKSITESYLTGIAAREAALERKRKEAMREAWAPVAQRMGDSLKRASVPPAQNDAAAAVPGVSGLGVAVRPNEPQLNPPPQTSTAPQAPSPQTKSTWTPGSPMQTRADMEAAARYHAGRAKVDPELVLRVLQAESAFNPNAVSKAGATGLMQLMPATAAQPGYGVTPLQNDSPEENLRLGVDYLSAMIREYGSPELALAAYNAGPGRVSKGGSVPNIPETQAYVSKIMGGYRPDTRTADVSDQPVPAVGLEGLPSRPDAQQQDPVRTFMAQADPNELSQLYQEGLGVMLQHPELAQEIAPSLEAFGKLGIARWMQSYDGDPASLDYFKHMGKGMAMFGQTMDPNVMLNAKLSINKDRRDDDQERRAERRDRTAILKDEADIERTRLDMDRTRLDMDQSRDKAERDEQAANLDNRKARADITKQQLDNQKTRADFERKQSFDSLKAIHKALSNDGVLSPAEISLLNGMGIKDIQTSVNGNNETVYSAKIPGMQDRVSGTAAELKSHIESIATMIGSDEAEEDILKTLTTKGQYGSSEQQLVHVQKTPGGGMTGSVVPIDGASAADRDDARWKQAEKLARERVKEMKGGLFGIGGTGGLDAYDGSETLAVTSLTRQFYDQLSGGSPSAPGAPQGLGAAPQAPQPAPAPKANESQAEEEQVYLEGKGIAIQRNGEFEIIWPEGEERESEKDGKTYVMKGGKAVPVDE